MFWTAQLWLDDFGIYKFIKFFVHKKALLVPLFPRIYVGGHVQNIIELSVKSEWGEILYMLGIIWWCSSDLSSNIWSSQSKYFLSTVKKNQNKFFFILRNKIYMSLFQESFFAMHSQHEIKQILQKILLCHCANLDIIQLMIDFQPLKSFPSKKYG